MSWRDLAGAWSDLPPGWLGTTTFLFGLIVGSFLNVVVHRLPRGTSLVHPRSHCPRCDRAIAWYENVPLVSWLLLRGRCAGCAAPIAWRYPALELLTGLLFLGAFRSFGASLALPVALLFIAAVLALVFIDLEHYLLPDAITLPGTFLGLALSWISPFVEPADALLGVLLAVLMLEGINLAYKLVRGRDGLGAGDTKMMMMVGAFLGWDLMVFTLVAAATVGAVIGIPVLLVGRMLARSATSDVDPVSPDTGSPASTEPHASDEPDGADDDGRRDDRSSALADLVPRRAVDLLVPATGVVLLASFFLPWTVPERALAGLLVGILCMVAHQRLRPQPASDRASESGGRGAESWALLGAAAGLPPTTASALFAAALAAAGFLVARPLDRLLLGRADGHADGHAGGHAEGDAALGGPPETGPGIMEAALPFGVFLGLGALVSLFAGADAIAWYFDLVTATLPTPPGP